MRKRGVRAFLISCIFWLLPGMAGGIFSAAYLSSREYQGTARLAGALQEEESLPAALKRAEKAESHERDEGIEEKGSAYLMRYGYRKYRDLAENLPFTLSINLLLFEMAGGILFFVRKKEEQYNENRIAELTKYLKAVERKEAAVLDRREDLFSRLEDEIYKTVAELACTKEKAVRDHEILAARIADIAHQLKTPLTSMSLMAELLEPNKQEEQEYLDRLRYQVDRLKSLVEGLLALAKLDSHTIEFRREEIGMEELLIEAADPLREQMERRKITLEFEKTEEIGIKVDIRWTSEAFLNILKNCVEHTPEGGRIKVSWSQNPLYTELIVEDGGEGFSKKDLPHLFERFYRGEQAAKDSAGIGLALSKLILEAQNGQISAENSANGHAQFRMKMYTHAGIP